jgi:hypothetical protein
VDIEAGLRELLAVVRTLCFCVYGPKTEGAVVKGSMVKRGAGVLRLPPS